MKSKTRKGKTINGNPYDAVKRKGYFSVGVDHKSGTSVSYTGKTRMIVDGKEKVYKQTNRVRTGTTPGGRPYKAEKTYYQNAKPRSEVTINDPVSGEIFKKGGYGKTHQGPTQSDYRSPIKKGPTTKVKK